MSASENIPGNHAMAGQQVINLADYTLHLADTVLVLGHRNSEWTGHGPILEQDIAISNIALDLIGQARNLYQYAATIFNQHPGVHPFTIPYQRPVNEDDLAYLRDGPDYKNVQMVELPVGDWAFTILRQFYFSAWQYLFYQRLSNSADEQLAAIAAKSVKETAYHLKWSSEWVIRLGDGTTESHERMLKAIGDLQHYFKDFFEPAPYEAALLPLNISIDVADLEADWQAKINTVFEEATLPFVDGGWWHRGGKTGTHTEHLGFLLAEMQFLQRAYPNSVW